MAVVTTTTDCTGEPILIDESMNPVNYSITHPESYDETESQYNCRVSDTECDDNFCTLSEYDLCIRHCNISYHGHCIDGECCKEDSICDSSMLCKEHCYEQNQGNCLFNCNPESDSDSDSENEDLEE